MTSKHKNQRRPTIYPKSISGTAASLPIYSGKINANISLSEDLKHKDIDSLISVVRTTHAFLHDNNVRLIRFSLKSMIIDLFIEKLFTQFF